MPLIFRQKEGIDTVAIARATEADAEELLAARIDAFSWDLETYGHGPPGYDSMEKLREGFAHENVWHYKILDGGRLIGGICVFRPDRGHCHLGGLYIDSGHQNQGMGSQAVKLLFQDFPDAERWTLDTPYLSFRNHHFYEKLGFRKVGETTPEADGFYLFQYEKTVG